MQSTWSRWAKRIGAALVALAVVLAASAAFAQMTTATLKGTVTNQSDKKPVGAATVAAQAKDTGFRTETKTDAGGSFVLAGLNPGSYTVSVTAPSFKAVSKDVLLQLGQDVNIGFQVTPDALFVEDVTVIGDTLVETRTSEIATNVTPEQINTLPQTTRNFFNAAQIAPGVTVSKDEFTKQFRGLGQPGNATNVFIDGASYKNDVLEGGVVGQDSSRGNPFPQNAVQEFQVLTQNFKAEYEKASTSIISAITKTGGNVWAGDAFVFWQEKSLVANDYFSDLNAQPKPDYRRFQGGISVGGPIIKDKLTMFVSWEQNNQNRSNRVTLGTSPDPNFNTTPYLGYQGSFTAPFRSNLYFAKLSWQPTLDQTVDFSYNRRDESDVRNFGGTTSYDTGEDVKVTVDTFNAKHKWVRQHFINEATVQWQSMKWNPTSLAAGTPQQNYFGFITIGSRNGSQDFKQDRISLRDDFSYFVKQHSLKFGAVVNWMNYDATKLFGGDGTFNYNYDPANGHDFTNPFEAYLNAGDPQLKTSNNQIDLYAQDDWAVTPKFTLNLGLRWDYETDMMNNKFVTPPEFVAALSGPIPADGVWTRFSDAERANYFSDGSNRKAVTDQFQPRIGFSYDFSGTGKSVLHGGAGRYYDRDLYNWFFDEKFRLQWRTYRFCFYSNPTEQAVCGAQGIAWNPAYLQPGALQNLLAQSSGALGKPEIFLIPNNLKVPYNDQLSLGYRHNFGKLLADLTLTTIHGKNGFSYIFGNRDIPSGNTVDINATYSNLLLATSDKEYWFNGMYITLSKPFNASAKWGFTATYTLSKAEQRGNDAFSLDYITVKDYPKFATPDDQRHKLYATGIVRIPWNVTLSANLDLESGVGYDIFNATNGFGFYQRTLDLRGLRPEKKAFLFGNWWAYRQVDVRAEKTIALGKSQSLGVIAQVFNIFNFNNFASLDGFIPQAPSTNTHYGQPNSTIGPTRSFELGLRYAF